MEIKNELIAVFLEWPVCNCGNGEKHYKTGKNKWEIYFVNGMRFHSSWDWLMPVIEKIGNTEFKGVPSFPDVEMNPGFCSIVLVESRFNDRFEIYIRDKSWIKATYEAVVEFIEWHNSIQGAQPPQERTED